jgi:hypothetical protein
MAFLYLAASAESTSPWLPGSGQSPTAIRIDSAKACSYPGCLQANCQSPRFAMTCARSREPISWATAQTSFTVGFRARTSVLRELELAWAASEADLSLRSCASLASANPDSSSWKTYQLSLFGGSTDFFWESMRWGLMRDGQLFQPQRWEPSIFVNDGTYLPTPTACDYGKNVGRKSDGITPSGRDRWSLTVRARRGELPGHPKGALNPEWIEQAMGYRIGWTAIADLAIPFIQKPRAKRSKDLED